MPTPHIWKHRGWWYASAGRGGPALCGYSDVRSVFALLRDPDELERACRDALAPR